MAIPKEAQDRVYQYRDGYYELLKHRKVTE